MKTTDGYIYLLDDTFVATETSQKLLPSLMKGKAEGTISEGQYERTIKREIRKGTMLYATGFESYLVYLTERPTGNCLLEFRVPNNDTLFYAFAKCFIARQR
jgi:hypothetical protein